MADEKKVEQKLVREVKRLDGLCLKIYSAWFTGLPDRLVIIPGAGMRFVELKGKKGVLSPRQASVHRRLAQVGAEVTVISSKEEVDIFIRQMEEVAAFARKNTKAGKNGV